MKFLSHFFSRGRRAPQSDREAHGDITHAALRRQRWQALPPAVPLLDQSVLQQALLVFDLETSGLDVRRDMVLSIGAVRIEQNALPLGRQFQRVLQVDTLLQADSQLIHGLTQADLQAGCQPAEALLDFLEYGADAIWLAFHAGFDSLMLTRAITTHLGVKLKQQALDIAALAPMLFPEHAVPYAGLEHWIQVFGLSVPARHHAVVDAMVTAELMLILLQRAHQRNLCTWGQLGLALSQWQRKQNQAAGPLF